MNRLYKFTILFFCLALLINSVSAQKIKPRVKNKVSSVQTKVDLGVLRQNTYTNDFFALKIEFPLGWLVGDNTLESQLMVFQKQDLRGTTAKNQQIVDKAVDRLTPLLGGYKALPGSIPENSNLRLIVENLNAVPNIKTSEDYLKAIIYSLGAVKLPPGFNISDVKEEIIDGKKIQYVETFYQSLHKRNYVMIKKRFAVLLTIEAFNEAEFADLHKVLQEADLDYKK